MSLAGLGITAANSSPVANLVGVWLGAVVGVMAADGLSVLAGRLLGHRLPQRMLRRISGTIFLVVGVAVLGLAVWSKL